jgi:lysine 2,3-aminomutase
VRDVRNQGVLMRGVNATGRDLLDLCFALQDEANILPYYFYMCDMIPNAEHWRVSVACAQELQDSIMGWLPGYATPRIVCDVPFVGKRWVHMVGEYDRELGVSRWAKKYRIEADIEADIGAAVEADTEHADAAAEHGGVYYDPIHSLPEAGRRWWSESYRSA